MYQPDGKLRCCIGLSTRLTIHVQHYGDLLGLQLDMCSPVEIRASLFVPEQSDADVLMLRNFLGSC